MFPFLPLVRFAPKLFFSWYFPMRLATNNLKYHVDTRNEGMVEICQEPALGEKQPKAPEGSRYIIAPQCLVPSIE